MERLMRDSMITLEERGNATFPIAILVDDLSQIRDIDWAHTNPIKTLEKMNRIPHEQLLNDTLTQSRVIEAYMIPYTVPFLELCLEVTKYCHMKEKILNDIEGTKIIDFTMEGIESAFVWSNEGIIFTMTYSIKFFNSMIKSGNLIKYWLVYECKDFQAKALSKPKRTYFYLTISIIINMLCKITGQENDQRCRKKFVGFIHHIRRGKGIRWSKVISDYMVQQLSRLI